MKKNCQELRNNWEEQQNKQKCQSLATEIILQASGIIERDIGEEDYNEKTESFSTFCVIIKSIEKDFSKASLDMNYIKYLPHEKVFEEYFDVISYNDCLRSIMGTVGAYGFDKIEDLKPLVERLTSIGFEVYVNQDCKFVLGFPL